jgi:hypothetical protein
VSTFRTASVWLVAIALVLVAAAFLLFLTAAQLTGEESGEVILRRSVATITDIDQSMLRIEQDLEQAAEAADGDTVLVPGFPLAVELTTEEARTLRGPELRDRILDESAAILYADGTSAWAATDEDAAQDIDRLSATGFIDIGLGLVQDDIHTGFLVVATLFGIMTLAMTAILLIVLPREARLLVLSLVVLASSMPFLAAAVGLRFAFRTLEADNDEFVNGMLDIGADSMSIPIRNFFTLTVLGVTLLILGSLVAWWESRSLRNQGQLADSGY